MSKLMLIDAVHPEETRVALINKGRVDDFDFETSGNEQLRGNIYLAKVTRVEPSLQACFIEYGGNRHGFLAFSEIHPDYYQLPQADREALLEEAAREAAEAADDDPDDDTHDDEAEDGLEESDNDADTLEAEADPASELDVIDADEDETPALADAETEHEATASEADDEGDDAAEEDSEPKTRAARSPKGRRKTRGLSIARRYKIQEVIRRRQVLLVQVVKEERGNKGAALTTYLSLAGRYSVLMPNTPRGGGISRKIQSGNDRRRLKSVMDELNVPKGMGLIVRTAGASRTKSEIKRDYSYLQNLWDKIRSKTMESVAPQLIHQEGGLVHRAMRDMFDREIEEVIVQGDAAYREAKDLTKTLMPTQARKVKRWTSPAPLFVSEGVEEQLDSIFSPVVQMKSGGYLVINQTEALVAIDVNSGKSTRERSIEQTAVRTNLEAAEEACRQMRLRDLAGLVVIDFIDMEENKNNRAVEKKMKDSLKFDRARVQNNRISQFGLMEISRQRRRTGVLQATSAKCEACDGTGHRRSIPSAALQLLRAIEARAAGSDLRGLTVTAPTEVALYILNSKRDALTAIEDSAGFTVAIDSAANMIPGDFSLKAENAEGGRRRRKKFKREDFLEGDADDHLLPEEEDEEDSETDTASAAPIDGVKAADETEDESGQRRKRRRRGRRGGRRRRREEQVEIGAPPADGGALLDGLALSLTNLLGETPDDLPAAESGGLDADLISVPGTVIRAPQEASTEESAAATEADPDAESKPKRKRRRRRRRGGDAATETQAETAEETPKSEAVEASEDAPVQPSENTEGEALEPVLAEAAAKKPKKPKKASPKQAERAPETIPVKVAEEVLTVPAPSAMETTIVEPKQTSAPVLETTAPKKKRRGWWSR